jgi:hypothetical protein
LIDLTVESDRVKTKSPSHDTANLVAVWSFWSQQFENFHRERWLDDEFHMLSWVLSLATASSLFRKSVLVTDTPGAKLLVDGLELPFAKVSTDLDCLSPSLRDWWVLGKLRAFRDQPEPFLHLDSDVYLWEPLPPALTRADIITQNPEPAPIDDGTYYKPTRIARAFDQNRAELPAFVTSYMQEGQNVAFCTGIFGGSALSVIHRFAGEAEHLVSNPMNARAWKGLNDPLAHSVYIEQYLLAALLAEEQRRRKPALKVGHLFTSQHDAFSERVADQVGFTHLIGEAKRCPILKELVARKVRELDPERYEIIRRLSRSEPRYPARVTQRQPVYQVTSAPAANQPQLSLYSPYRLAGDYSSRAAYGYEPWATGIGVSRLARH